jgi:uncharacterized protein (DUF2164 family)
MRKDGSIKLDKEKRAGMITAIKNFYLTDREEEIGDLAAGFLLDFIVEKLAPEFYNQGITDAHKYMETQVEDLLSLQKR